MLALSNVNLTGSPKQGSRYQKPTFRRLPRKQLKRKRETDGNWFVSGNQSQLPPATRTSSSCMPPPLSSRCSPDMWNIYCIRICICNILHVYSVFRSAAGGLIYLRAIIWLILMQQAAYGLTPNIMQLAGLQGDNILCNMTKIFKGAIYRVKYIIV